MYRLILFGGVSVEGPAGSLTGRVVQRRQLALLALLARASHTPLTREKAVGILWPERPEDRARARLSDALYVIRQELGEEAIVPVGEAVRLSTDRVWTDVGAFEEAAAESRWQEAVDFYTGPFLDGFHAGGSTEFEHWVDGERARLSARYREGLEVLAEEAEAEGDQRLAASWLMRRAAEEPTNSRVAIRLMKALAAAGNVPGALEHARVHALLLEDELGLPLSEDVRALADALLKGDQVTQAEVRDPPAPPDVEPAGEDREVGDEGASTDRVQPVLKARDPERSTAPPAARRRPVVFGAGVLALMLSAAAAWWAAGAMRGNDAAWVTRQAVPQIEELSREGHYDDAWSIARKAAVIAPDDPDLSRLLLQFTWLWPGLRTRPSGARVLHRPYGDRDAPWEVLGTTPLDTFRLPLGATTLRLELDAHRPVLVVPDDYLEEFPLFALDPPERLPAEMVRIPGFQADHARGTLELGDFLMDRFEVTNRDYLRFVEAGGYRSPEYWQYPLVLDGDRISWEDAMGHFHDRTGRPGPATWEVGLYPDGTADEPVGGVSWYEAAAYARFAGKSLPSVHHWQRAFGSRFFPEHVVPVSNLQSDGPAEVGEHPGMGPFGTFDMAGNVREWSYNAVGGERRVMGGGWDDPDHMALGHAYPQAAFERSPANGMRLVTYLEDEDDPDLKRALEPVEAEPVPDYRAEISPPSDEVFEAYRAMYAYDDAPLDARIEKTDTARHWVRQTVSFNAAYPGERVLLHLYLPPAGDPPLQTVVYWPGASARVFTSIDQKIELHTEFIVQSGRALAFPVLKGTLERVDYIEPAQETHLYRDRKIQQVQDIMRTIDYLASRDDIDTDGLAYFGWSWGGASAPLPLALEPRLRAAVLHMAGILDTRPRPEVDPVNFLSRVTVPVLVLNGRLDAIYPLETHARPFFESLGTPPDQKRLVLSDGGHFMHRPELVRESLDWLDRFLGPVEGY